MNATNWLLVLLGAAGALAAIVLKEVVQAALKRQILLGQLSAYVNFWALQAVRSPIGVQAYRAVKARDEKLLNARLRSKQAALEQIAENNRTRDEFREEVKAELMKAVSNKDGRRQSFASSAISSIGPDALAINRQYLMEGKTFLSDSDAAQLGPAIASCVVSFRSSTMQVLLTIETLIKLIKSTKEDEPDEELFKATSSLIDSLIADGEGYLTSLIRLETNVARARNLNLLQHCWNILRGK